MLSESLNEMGNGELLQGPTYLPNFLSVPALNPFQIIVEVIELPQGETSLTLWHIQHSLKYPKEKQDKVTGNKCEHSKDPDGLNKRI